MGIPGFPFLRDFRDPVVIIGTPFSTQMADDTGDAYDSGGYSQFSGKEWLSAKRPIDVVEIMYRILTLIIGTIQLFEHPFFPGIFVFQAFEHPCLKLLFQHSNTYSAALVQPTYS